MRSSGSYFETRYEDLVHEPEKTLQVILSHLGLDFEPGMLRADAPQTEGAYEERWLDRSTPRAWNRLPNQPVSASSVGRYRERLTQEQLSTIYRVRLTDRAREELDAPVSTFRELLELLGYETDETVRVGSAPRRRVVERTYEVRDYVLRAGRTLRYKRRLPRRLTTIGA